MQTTRKAVRYYIDREADTPIIRSVPVSCLATDAATAIAPAHRPEQDVNAAPANGAHRPDARHRLTSMVQASMRKYRHHAS